MQPAGRHRQGRSSPVCPAGCHSLLLPKEVCRCTCLCAHTSSCVCVQAEPGALLLSLCAGWVRTVGHYLVLPLQAAMGREKGVTCAGHGANVDYPNLHFRHFLFPGKRGKVKPILNHCGMYLALQQSHGLIAAFY